MPLEFNEGYGLRNIMQEDYLLAENPFRVSEIYNPDNPGTYDPTMYGKQYDEFYEKFFLRPLMRGKNKQVIGAIWSSQSASDWRGFGKSMLMAEESKLICRDFGASFLGKKGVTEKDIAANPVLAGYCTFDQAKDVKTFSSAILDAVAFMLEQPHGEWTVHQELRNRIAAKGEAEEGYEGTVARRLVMEALHSYKSLNVQLNHKSLDRFIDLLCGDTTTELTAFIRNEIGPRVKANQGFNFVHVFNAYAILAGIVSVVYFVDQIETFSNWARNQDREIKILRESICQTSPTAEIASFVFQMHASALTGLENWWLAEHLPSLDFETQINQTRIINLKGLQTSAEAEKLALKYLGENRVEGMEVSSPLHPFTEAGVEYVRAFTKGNPRKFLETLGVILDHAVQAQESVIDLSLIESLLGEGYEDTGSETEEDDFDNVER